MGDESEMGLQTKIVIETGRQVKMWDKWRDRQKDKRHNGMVYKREL